jgi:hypothetical protein
MCRELRLALLHVATLRTYNFEITNEFVKYCALLTAYIQISDSLFYLLELRATKSLELIHLSFSDWSLPFTNASSLIINLDNSQIDIFLVVTNGTPYEISFAL